MKSGKAKNKPVMVPPGCARLATVPVFDRVGFQVHGHDRYRRLLGSKCLQHLGPICEDDIDIGADDLRHHRRDPRRITVGHTQDQLNLRWRQIAACPKTIHHRLNANRDGGLRTRIKHTHPRRLPSLLRARRERPRGRRAAEQRDEFAPFHCPVPRVLPNKE